MAEVRRALPCVHPSSGKENTMICIIANETAGNGTGKTALEEVKKLLKQRNLPFHVYTTNEPRHASDLADQALREGDQEIICIGGDGTFSEIINGLAGRFATVYFVPCGTGNDFVRMLPLPKEPAQALKVQLDGQPRRIDVGQINDRYFLNVSGCGFDTEVLKQAVRFKKLGKGLLPYLLGIFAALRHFQPMSLEIISGEKREKRSVTIFTVGNGSYFGGGMKAAPHASIDDGLFDVLIADEVGRLRILKLLSKFIAGRHTQLPIVHEWRCREVTIHCPGMTVNIDGELVEMDTARYVLLPGAIEIRI